MNYRQLLGLTLLSAIMMLLGLFFTNFVALPITSKCDTTITSTTTMTITAVSTVIDRGCYPKNPVDFRVLKQINTTLSKSDILKVYILAMDQRSCLSSTYFLNPLAAPKLGGNDVYLGQSSNYGALPEDLPGSLKCKYVFAYFDDVSDNNRVICDIPYISVSSPKILSNGTVLIQIEGRYNYGSGSRFAAMEYSLAKTPAGNWNITGRNSLYIS